MKPPRDPTERRLTAVIFGCALAVYCAGLALLWSEPNGAFQRLAHSGSTFTMVIVTLLLAALVVGLYSISRLLAAYLASLADR